MLLGYRIIAPMIEFKEYNETVQILKNAYFMLIYKISSVN